MKLAQGEARFGFHVLAAVDAVEFDIGHGGVEFVDRGVPPILSA